MTTQPKLLCRATTNLFANDSTEPQRIGAIKDIRAISGICGLKMAKDLMEDLYDNRITTMLLSYEQYGRYAAMRDIPDSKVPYIKLTPIRVVEPEPQAFDLSQAV